MSPAIARIIPFAVYIAFLAVESVVPESGIGFDPRWLYAAKAACVALALGLLWKRFGELHAWRTVRTIDWALAALIGFVIFVIWILLDQPWATFGNSGGWDPTRTDGTLNWGLVTTRLIGAVLLVPVMEELFWRSLVMRWIRNADFLNVAPSQVGGVAVLVSSILFALEHHQWLAGLLAGFAYAYIYIRSGNLWTPILAHAVTNLLLGVWVLFTGRWQFW